MKPITRRAACAALLAGGLDLALESQGYGLISLLGRLDQISAQEYVAVRKRLTEAGVELDEPHSMYIPESRNLVIFLPDQHTQSFARGQRQVIQSIDGCVDVDAIGLEGIAGVVDEDICKSVQEIAKEIYDRHRIPHIRKDSQIDYTKIEADPPEIALQKLRVQFDDSQDWATGGFWKTQLFKNDHKSKNERYAQYSQFELDFGILTTQIPSRDRDYFPISFMDPVTRHLLITQMRDTEPRHDAPGLLYFDMPTKARKVGIETKVQDDSATCLFDSYVIQMDLSRVLQHIKKSDEAFEKVRSNYAGQGTPEEQNIVENMFRSYSRFMTAFKEHTRRMAGTRDALLARLPHAVAEAVRTSSYDIEQHVECISPFVEDIIVIQRSKNWVKNLSKDRIALLVGGQAHTDSVYNAAREQGSSIISAKYKE